MKKEFLFTVLCLLFFITGCNAAQTDGGQSLAAGIIRDQSCNYQGSMCKGNYVWGAAMNLAWNELNDNILHEKLQLDTLDATALDMVEKFNFAPFSKTDLDEASYYIKSGYGQETVEAINRESREKFPSKSFDDLDISLDPNDIISYAYFLKEVEYKSVFKKEEVLFNGQKVPGFAAGNETQKKTVKLLSYDNDDKFIIKLSLLDNSDELILAKGYDMQSPRTIVNEIRQHLSPHPAAIRTSDVFMAPEIHLDHHRVYSELIDKRLKNKDFKPYYISEMFENIRFDMDEKGARVENEGVIAVRLTAVLEPAPPRHFVLDKPYWIVMKRADSPNPYFILGINNCELMGEK